MKKLTFSIFIFQISILACFGQTNAASFPLNFDDGYTILHSNAKVEMIVKNDGSATITSLKYTVEDFSSGSVSSEKIATLDADIPAGEQGTATFKVPAGSEVGISQKIVTITKVNGVTNETSEVNASAIGYVHTLSEKMTKRTIEEEYTGTWCGWCPRGTVGMELLAEKYPDTYIGAAFHYDDEFWFSDEGYHDGFPACELNRHVNIDPYNGTTGNLPFGIEKDYLKEQNILPLASLEMKATWTDDTKKSFNVKSDMKFVYNTDDEFALLYIITEDGLIGSSQHSYYSSNTDYADDPYMDFWYKGGTTSTYNHVVVDFAGRENGIEGSVSSPVTVDMTQSYDYTFDISANNRIKDKDKLHMIVCLLDRTTGTIINTDFGDITNDNYAGINIIPTLSLRDEATYNTSGQRINANTKGLIIQKGKKILK